ncbi:MAG: PDZ domain-containing protein, partial [Acidimicrobiia bacterium]
LIEVGRARHSFLGVTGNTSFTTTADGAQSPAGVRIEEVVEGSAAADVALVPGDVITAVNGQRVVTMDGLIIMLRNFSVGEDILVALLHDGADKEVTVTLGERPGV